MVRLEATRENKSFAERIKILTNYISPLRQMWPYYWLKAAAVRDPESAIWQLRYLSIIGRWSENKPVREVCDKGNAIVAISQMIDAARAWELLSSLQTNGTVSILPDIVARAELNPDMTQPTASYWQEPVPFLLSKAVAEVAETAEWRYLFLFEHKSVFLSGVLWSVDEEDFEDRSRREADDRMKHAIQEELDDRGLIDFALFTSTRLGLGYGGSELGCSQNDFFYQFDLPLALRIERGIPDRDTNTLPLTIYSRRPLMLETLKINIGDPWMSKSQPLTVQIECSSDHEWSVGNVLVPYDCGKISLQFQQLTRTLTYEIPTPTAEDEISEIIGSMYLTSSPEEGKSSWKKHLIESVGSDFEIALLNALTRLGVLVLFAGQVQQIDQPGGGGTSTMGYDLIALNYAKRRAVLISAKGAKRVPTDDDCQKLLDRVASIQTVLRRWYVTGIMACHASDNRLGRFKGRTDLRIWSIEDLECLYQADNRVPIERLLWTPPGTSTLLEQILSGRDSR